MSLFYRWQGLIALGLLALNSVAWADGIFVKLTDQQIYNLGVKLARLEIASQVPLFTAPAKVVVPPAHDFVVSTPQDGLVVKMTASVGDKVAKGEMLALVNSPSLLSLQGDYLKAVGDLKLASATYERDKKLRQEGVVSGRNEEASFSGFNAAKIEANEARQLLQIAGITDAELKRLGSTGQVLSQLKVKSPITGRVIERMVTTGTHIESLSPLYRIANLDELWLEINIPQEHITDVTIGDKVQVENGLAQAEIKVLSQSVNPENQTILARAVIQDNPASVRVGQKVTVQHLPVSTAVTYLLPDTAIANHETKSYIFIKVERGL